LMRILGHENLAMTQRYVNLATKDLIEQNLKCNPLRSLSLPEPTNNNISTVENSIPQLENSITRVDNNIAQ
jgi:hypothetical protein